MQDNDYAATEWFSHTNHPPSYPERFNPKTASVQEIANKLVRSFMEVLKNSLFRQSLFLSSNCRKSCNWYVLQLTSEKGRAIVRRLRQRSWEWTWKRQRSWVRQSLKEKNASENRRKRSGRRRSWNERQNHHHLHQLQQACKQLRVPRTILLWTILSWMMLRQSPKKVGTPRPFLSMELWCAVFI